MLFTETFTEKLEHLDFRVLNSENSPVIFVSELTNVNNILSPSQILSLEEAKSYNADAVFFRYFEDENRPPLPQIYIYDNGSGKFNSKYEQIHKERWSSCNIPACIIVEDFRIRIFDCRKPVKINSNGKIFTKEIASIDTRDIAKYADVIEKYNADKFSNGTFWESDEAHNHFTYGKTPYKDLIDNLKILRQNYKGNNSNHISPQLSDYVIIISILIKYLEENGIDEDGNNLASNFFNAEVQCKTFVEILEKNKLVSILDSLANKFNGGIFSLTSSQKTELRKANLAPIVSFFDGRIAHNNQLVLWPLYSFKHIPVELISNIYEEFIPEDDRGAVYTPHYLVNLLIDECIPLPTKNTAEIIEENIKLIDVSCGSGIFLVNAFKRLLQVHQIKEYFKTGIFPKKVAIKKLYSILEKNIFGIDINQHAVDLTKFSLSLAICHVLSPQQIWTELTFEDLGKNNIQHKDFFDFISVRSNLGKYDLVLGNPPFNPPFDEQTQKPFKNSDYVLQTIEKFQLKSDPIGDNDLALFFLQQSIKLLKKNSGLLCLIQKSIPLLHTKENETFRRHLFNEYSVPQIIDFTPYRRVLFHNVTVPTCAIFVENKLPIADSIVHVVIKRTKAGKERLFFEIDTYDIHYVNRTEAYQNISWKVNLFGGYRLLGLVNKLKDFPQVKDFISNETDRKGTWSKKDIKTYQENGLFLSTKITHGKFPEPITNAVEVNRSTWGVIGDSKKISLLKNYFKRNGNLLCTYIAGTSARQGIDRTYDLYTEDIRNLPMLDKKEIENLSTADRIILEDVAEYKISEFGDPEKSVTNQELIVRGNKPPKKLMDFSQTYINALNSVLKKGNKEFHLVKVCYSKSSFVLEFEYSKPKLNNDHEYKMEYIKSNLDTLTNFTQSSALIKRVSNIYTQNRIFLIKPKQLRFWLRMIALVDADSTISDIVTYKMEAAND